MNNFYSTTREDFNRFRVDNETSNLISLTRAKNAYKRGVETLSLKKDDELIAIVSLRRPYPRMLEASSLVSNKVEKYPVFYTKNLKALIDAVFESDKLDRLQMFTKDTDKNRKWGKTLGMELEVELPKYGTDSVKHLLFSKVRED